MKKDGNTNSKHNMWNFIIAWTPVMYAIGANVTGDISMMFGEVMQTTTSFFMLAVIVLLQVITLHLFRHKAHGSWWTTVITVFSAMVAIILLYNWFAPNFS